MDSEQQQEISSGIQVSGISSNIRSRYSYPHGDKAKKKTGKSIFKPNIYVLLAIVLAGVAYVVYSMYMKIEVLESSKREEATMRQKYESQLKVVVSGYQTRIDELGKEVQKLSDLTNNLKQELASKGQPGQPPKPKPYKFQSINQSALMPYIQKQFQDHKLAIDFLHEHSRQSYFYQKVDFIRSCIPNSPFLKENWKAKDAFLLSINNFQLPHFNINIEKQRKGYEQKDYDRLSKQYDFSLPELSFCIVVATVNNARNFRYQYNLQSMINLNYKNFKIVIIDDASTDNTHDLIRQWIVENQITQNIILVKNKQRLTAVPNIYTAVTKHCHPDDIVTLVDGDDEILGRNAFKVFNHVYQKNNADVVYSNHLQFYTHTFQVFRGWSMSYSDDQKRNNRYRDVPQRIAHLRSFKAKLFLKIKEEDLKDKNGEWFTSTYDEVICLPILEMSCGKSVYVDEYFYLYNFGIGTNDLQVDKGLQKSIADEVKFKRKKYQCLKQ